MPNDEQFLVFATAVTAMVFVVRVVLVRHVHDGTIVHQNKRLPALKDGALKFEQANVKRVISTHPLIPWY